MGTRTSYAPGTFSWAELSTTDVDGAKRFYGALFGWEAEDLPIGDGNAYTMFRLDGQNAAATFPQMEDERSQGIPPHWNSYVSVDDLDRRAAHASELGGNVVAPPFDVMDVGRMAVVQDPAGAFFMLWEPKSSIGAGIVNVHGGLAWNELGTTDVDAAKRFYGELFGWTYEDLEMDGAGYSIVKNGESSNGGIRRQTPQEEGVPPNWLVYFGADSATETCDKAGGLGGQVFVPPTSLPAGTFAVIQDPQGAVFAVFEGEFDD